MRKDIKQERERDSETLRVRKIKDYAIMVLKIKKQTEREKKEKNNEAWMIQDLTTTTTL